MPRRPVLRKFIVPGQLILAIATPRTRTAIQPTASVQATIALVGARTREGIEPLQINTRGRFGFPLRHEQDVPDVRQDAARDAVVARRCLQQPLAQRDVLVARVLPDAMARHDELRTALRANRIGAPEQQSRRGLLLMAAEQEGERARQRRVRDGARVPRHQRGLHRRLQAPLRRRRRRTRAGAPVAAHVMVSPGREGAGHVERGQQGGVVVVGGVVVPGPARAVHEDGAGGREVGVVVDEKGQICHGFMAAVGGHWEISRRCRRRRFVGAVDAQVVGIGQRIEPAGIAVGGNT